MEKNTAKHFVLQLGSLASLYLSLSFTLVLLFGVINLTMPDAADSIWEINQAKEGIKIGFAMVIVFFPTYLALTRIVNRNRRRSSEHNYLGLTKWLIYLSLLVAGAVLLGDLVAVVMAYLDGDITTRFLLKALSLLIIVGSAFTYYLLDAKSYWMSREKASKLCGLGATILVLFILICGFKNIDSPAEARELKLDNQQITDLQEIQWSIYDYLTANETLPASLDDLDMVNMPEATGGRTAYEYHLTETGFELCATFAYQSDEEDPYSRAYPITADKDLRILGTENWQHEAGRYCFDRVVK
ncbi:hypothetical protein KC851_04040 [Candidatus Kaiserbacteria bacterium]|nr:hypothetical protein [Candidatus Kaiserbacteria bacterium]